MAISLGTVSEMEGLIQAIEGHLCVREAHHERILKSRVGFIRRQVYICFRRQLTCTYHEQLLTKKLIQSVRKFWPK